MEMDTMELARALLEPRRTDAHKGDFGRLLVIAGSPGMAGAAALCARGALRSGAGLVTVCIHEGLFPAIHALVPEATCMPRGGLDDAGGLSRFDAIALGPGLGDSPETAALAKRVLRAYGGKAILDADALNALAGDMDAFGAMGDRSVISPHSGEAARLLGLSLAEVEGDRPGAARRLAALSGGTAVLKGAGSLIAHRDGRLLVNESGNPGMATGGSGDVLTGIIASFAGQGLDPFGAAAAGVYVHGRAGDISAERRGEYGLMASDIAECAALAILGLTGR
jgi:NAD(P)H-hydrate epimerase